MSKKENINDINNPKSLEIHIFPGTSNTYKLYEDDGVSSLYEQGYYKDFDILCADNAITMIKKDANFARFLYKKDLVKI